MRTPRHVATVCACALAVTVLVASVVRELLGSPRGDAVLDALAEAALGSLFLGTFVWLGTYFGARYSAPYQRSDRLIRVLSLTYIALGVILSLPFQTHAVRLDMPAASYTSSGGGWDAVLLPLGFLALVVVIPFVLTRALAIALVKGVQP